MPKAGQNVIDDLGYTPKTIRVTRGGFLRDKGQVFYKAPCETCYDTLPLNPFLQHTTLPPGVPEGLAPSETYPFTPPDWWGWVKIGN